MSFWDNLKNTFTNQNNNTQVQNQLSNLANQVDNIRLNQLASRGYDQNTINNVRQGLNGGDKYLQGFIEQNNIRTPQTPEEINLARQGQFNVAPNNVNQAFAQGVNQARGTQPQANNTPEWRNILASALIGIGRTPYDANSGIMGSLAKGVAAGQNNYQNYKMAKNVYDGMGMDTSNMSILGDYSKFTPDTALKYGIQNRNLQVKKDIASAKDNTTRARLILNAYNDGLPAEDAMAQLKLYGIDLNNLPQESNNTRKTNSQIELNEQRKKAIDATIKQNAQRIKILQQRVNQGAATASDRHTLNQLNIQNKQLLIKQNELINQSLINELGGGNNPHKTNAF